MIEIKHPLNTSFGDLRSTYLDLHLIYVGWLWLSVTELEQDGPARTYQVADENLAFSRGRGCSCRRGGSLRRLSSLLDGVLVDTTSRDTSLGRTLAAGIGAAGSGNLIEALVELGRHDDGSGDD